VKAPLPKAMDWSALGNQSRLFGAGQTEIMTDRGAGPIVEPPAFLQCLRMRRRK